MTGPKSVEVSDAIVKGAPDNQFVINIGCHDGKSMHDPCYPLYARGCPGIAIDGGVFPAVYENLPNDNITKLMKTPISPLNCAKTLRANGCPDHPHMLKVDIDGYDRDVLVSILSNGIRPDFFQVEIQPEMPPPVVFSVLYHPLFRSTMGHGGFYGLSVSAAEMVGIAFDYSPITLDNTTPGTHDMIFIRNDLIERSGFKPLDTRVAYKQEVSRAFHFRQSGINSRTWQRRDDFGQLIIEIFQACTFASQARFGVVLPFELGLDYRPYTCG